MCNDKDKTCKECKIANCLNALSNTAVPATPAKQILKAEAFLDHFGQYTTYKHRGRNPYLKWLRSGPKLAPDVMYRFFNFWQPVSRHQPQILLRIAASYPCWNDRKLIMKNYLEEDGMVNVGDHPHYDLLEMLLMKLGGRLDIDPEAEAIVSSFHRSIVTMTAAEATGYVAAIEHPALDISDYFTTLARLAQRDELLKSDPYLSIHVDVEPKHIIWSHGNALDWIQDRLKQEREKYSADEVIQAFKHAMEFWDGFWALAFEKLGYQG